MPRKTLKTNPSAHGGTRRHTVTKPRWIRQHRSRAQRACRAAGRPPVSAAAAYERRDFRRSLATTAATARMGIRMSKFETSPASMASMRLAEPLGMVLGRITATNTTPKANGRTCPVTAAVLRIVTTRAIIMPMRNRSVSCESTRSIKTAIPRASRIQDKSAVEMVCPRSVQVSFGRLMTGPESQLKPRPGHRVGSYRAESPAKMSFLWVPPGTNSVPITTVITAITIAYHKPE